MLKFFYYVFAFFLITNILPPSYAQVNEKELDQYLFKYYKATDIPSISAGAYHKGKIWLKAEGFADMENYLAASPRTIYRIASVSKPITAVAIMQLYEQKKISLDDDVRKYLPWFPQKKWKFTIRQVLSHTAGIRNYKPGEFDSKTYFQNTREVLNYLSKDSLDYQPGTNFNYTTLGYNLLAGVIEAVSGMSYPDYMRKHIFNVCGMTLTNFEYQSDIIYNRAHGYYKNSFRKLLNAPLADLSIKFPGGGIISTPEDLLKFGASLLAGKLIKKETLDTMLVPIRLKSGRVISYSLGFTAGLDEHNRKYFTHSGGGTGFSSQLLFYPDENLVTVFLTNIRDRNVDYPASMIARMILEKSKPVVKTPVSDKLMDLYTSRGIDTTLIVFNTIKKDSSDFFVLTADELNNFGTDLLACYRFKDAINYYKTALNDYPAYSKLYIGLADAYFRDGNKGLALKNYRIASNLDPKSIYASDMIRKIEQQ